MRIVVVPLNIRAVSNNQNHLQRNNSTYSFTIHVSPWKLPFACSIILVFICISMWVIYVCVNNIRRNESVNLDRLNYSRKTFETKHSRLNQEKFVEGSL